MTPNIDLGKTCPELADVVEKAELQKQYVKEGRFDISNSEPYCGPRLHSFEVSYYTIDAIRQVILKLAAENELWRENFAGGILDIEEMLRKRLAARKGDPA